MDAIITFNNIDCKDFSDQNNEGLRKCFPEKVNGCVVAFLRLW
jgi:hypothetical protein